MQEGRVINDPALLHISILVRNKPLTRGKPTCPVIGQDRGRPGFQKLRIEMCRTQRVGIERFERLGVNREVIVADIATHSDSFYILQHHLHSTLLFLLCHCGNCPSVTLRIACEDVY